MKLTTTINVFCLKKIPLILCNKLFKCTEDFTLARLFINCSIYIKVLKKH